MQSWRIFYPINIALIFFYRKIHILGSFQNIKMARTAICNLILGKSCYLTFSITGKQLLQFQTAFWGAPVMPWCVHTCFWGVELAESCLLHLRRVRGKYWEGNSAHSQFSSPSFGPGLGFWLQSPLHGAEGKFLAFCYCWCIPWRVQCQGAVLFWTHCQGAFNSHKVQ